jgi:hypothetical protein
MAGSCPNFFRILEHMPSAYLLGMAVHSPERWTDTGVDNGHGGALTGARPPATPVHQSSPAGAQNGEGARGDRLGPQQSSGGGVVTGRRRWREEVTGTRWGGVPARERRREGLGEVWGAPGVVGVAFIGPGEGAGGWP